MKIASIVGCQQVNTHTRTHSPEANPTNALSCWWLWHRYANYNCTIVLRPAAPSERLAKVKSSSEQPLLMASSQMRQCCQCDVSMCILNTYYVSAAYRKPNLTGVTISFDVHEASQLLEFSHSFANTHTRTWLASIRNENIAPFYVCLPAKSKHIMLPHTHRVRLALFAMNELQPTLDTHTKTHTHTHSHLSIHSALLFGFKNWISPWASFITLISRRHPQLIDQAFLAW